MSLNFFKENAINILEECVKIQRIQKAMPRNNEDNFALSKEYEMALSKVNIHFIHRDNYPKNNLIKYDVVYDSDYHPPNIFGSNPKWIEFKKIIEKINLYIRKVL